VCVGIEGELRGGEQWGFLGKRLCGESWVIKYEESVFGDDTNVFRLERWGEAEVESGGVHCSILEQ
jgi:hypothetical protein